MVALLSSLVIVALAEMGDKTQLLAFSLTSRYRRPWTVMLGILFATAVNHALAASVGVWLSLRIPESILGWVLGLGFIAFGVWTLFPDTVGERTEFSAWGPLISTVVLFFLAEMGDKTQLATMALGARFGSPVMVTAGTTLGMVAADGLAVFAGSYTSKTLPMAWVRAAASTLFVVFGLEPRSYGLSESCSATGRTARADETPSLTARPSSAWGPVCPRPQTGPRSTTRRVVSGS